MNNRLLMLHRIVSGLDLRSIEKYLREMTVTISPEKNDSFQLEIPHMIK